MKKQLLTFLFICVGTIYTYAQQKAFEIKGTVKDPTLNGHYVYFLCIKNDDYAFDSVKVENSQYTFNNTIDRPTLLSIGRQMYAQEIKVIIEPGKTTKVDHEKEFASAKVTGTLSNKQYNQVRKDLDIYYKKMNDVDERHVQALKANDKIKEEQLIHEGDSIYAAMIEDVYPNFIRKNPASPIVFAMLDQYMPAVVDPEKLEPLYYAISGENKKSIDGIKWGKKLAIALKTGVGKIAPDFVQNDSMGNPLKLSSLRGKYVLVDFWASWCGPCRNENPNVVKAYKKLKSKGFEVLSISIDANRSAWVKAIKEDGMPWLHVSDLKGNKNEAALLYGVESIPQNWLLDPNGVVVAVNLRGEDLDQQIEKYIGKKD